MNRFKWFGLDYGQCLMDSRFRRVEYWLAAVFIDDEDEKRGVIDEKLEVYNQLLKKYGNFRKLHEHGRHEIHSLILENNRVLIRRFYEVEQKLLKPAEGVIDALTYLKKKYSLGVISDMADSQVIIRFLNHHGLRQFFTNIYTPSGVVREHGGLDEGFKGTKEDGSIYASLKKELEIMGIQVNEAVIIGDDPIKDIANAKMHGFTTVHYVGNNSSTQKPSSEADYVITHFSELKEKF
ncbi:MAG: HAD hydrolase-like protein [Candidatus Caldarchaeum sp.]|uniref:HAD family hydrolase n=1 Tax=Caldiarchaeum subterraneum TaxID=311458 RepID=A0A7C5QP83_CALS0